MCTSGNAAVAADSVNAWRRVMRRVLRMNETPCVNRGRGRLF
jgi:hypothetical protein